MQLVVRAEGPAVCWQYFLGEQIFGPLALLFPMLFAPVRWTGLGKWAGALPLNQNASLQQGIFTAGCGTSQLLDQKYDALQCVDPVQCFFHAGPKVAR